MTDLTAFTNLAELEDAARQVSPRATFDYYAGGANDEITLRDNVAAYSRLRLRYRVLAGVETRDPSVTILGTKCASPILIAPMAFQRLAHPDGEIGTARAAAEHGMGMVLSTLSTSPVADVRAATPSPLFFQLYIYKDRAVTRELVERIESAGCQALILTVDAPVIGRRERDIRNQFRIPDDLAVPNALPVPRSGEAMLTGSGLAAYVNAMIDPAIAWRDVEWLRSISRLPLVIKGIVRGDDAARASDLGVAGIVVSNHGGRQLDTSPATIDALPEVVDAVGGQVEVFVDGGVRRGTDIIKALALGARGVLVGRPVLWGLALGGSAGVSHVLGALAAELDMAMALCGAPTIADVTGDLIA